MHALDLIVFQKNRRGDKIPTPYVLKMMCNYYVLREALLPVPSTIVLLSWCPWVIDWPVSAGGVFVVVATIGFPIATRTVTVVTTMMTGPIMIIPTTPSVVITRWSTIIASTTAAMTRTAAVTTTRRTVRWIHRTAAVVATILTTAAVSAAASVITAPVVTAPTSPSCLRRKWAECNDQCSNYCRYFVGFHTTPSFPAMREVCFGGIP